MDIKAILILVAFVAAIAIYVVVREKINLSKAATGEDKERLRKAVAQVLPGELGYRVAYGHYEKVEHFGRRTRTTYYCYALAFDASRLWVMPLRFEKERILPSQPVLLTSGVLGIADIIISNDKEGRARRVDFTLHDRDGESFLDCVVEVTNTRDDRYHHVNIVQPEETAQFAQLIGAMSAQVNRDNAGLRARVRASTSNLRNASLLGTLSIVLGVFISPAGLVLSIVGIRLAKAGQAGGKAPAPLILCCAGLVVSILFMVLYAAALVLVLLK